MWLIGGAVGLVLLGVWAAVTFSRMGNAEPVRIGYLPIYVDLPLFVAQERGLFRKHGVDVELVRFASSPDIGTALVTNDIQVGASIAYSVVLSTESRDPGKLKVFIVDSETPENYLSSILVMPGSGIESLSDLKGKTLASFPGPTAVTFCKLVLEKAGLNPDLDLKLVEIDVASHLPALAARKVDALFTYEPTGTQGVMELGAVRLVAGPVERMIINPWQAGVWVVSERFAIEDQERAAKVVLALYEAIDYLRTNPESAKESLTAYTSIKPNVARATPSIPFAKLGEVDLDAFQRHADILRDRGIISKRIEAKSLLAPTEWLRVHE